QHTVVYAVTVEHRAEFFARAVLIGARVVALLSGERKPRRIDDVRMTIDDTIFVGHDLDFSFAGLDDGLRGSGVEQMDGGCMQRDVEAVATLQRRRTPDARDQLVVR